MSIKATFRAVKLEGELREQQLVMRQMRNFLAGALCCACGEPLGQGKIVSDDEDRTVHADCECES